MTPAVCKTISIVIPAYCEALGIVNTIDAIGHALRDLEYDYEIIVVDDGSPDETYHRVRELAERDGHVRGVRLSRNFGKEAALLAGLRAACGDAVITIDADLQHPPALVPHMIREWERGAKVVNAVKRDRGDEHLLARWRAAVFNALLSRLGGVKIHNSSDFKLLDRQAVDVVCESLPEKMRFYRGLAEWIGFEQQNLLFDVDVRRSGASSWSVRSLAGLALTALVSFTSVPLRLVTLLGITAMLFGGIVGADALWSWMHNRAVSGFATIIMTLLLIGSFIMISLGIIGEYIAKIYDEVKRRPNYLIASTCGDMRSMRAGIDPQRIVREDKAVL